MCVCVCVCVCVGAVILWNLYVVTSFRTDAPKYSEKHFSRLLVPEFLQAADFTDHTTNKLCGRRHNMPRPSPPSVGTEAPRAAEPTAPDRNVHTVNTFPRSPLQLPDA